MPEPLDRRISAAPMMGCTDRHCRTLLRLISPHALLYTEMITTGALLHGDTERFLAHGHDAPCGVQLGGSDPEGLATSARLAAQAGYQEVNLNVGCPSGRVQQGGIGACLMAEPQLVADCVGAMQAEVDIPVTVKSRIGIDDQDSYDFFCRFVDTVRGGGCQVFIVHARKAILSGLSPRENRDIPPLRYEFVRQIREDFPDLTFVINGGIKDSDAALALLDEFDGVMLGRALYGDPWLLATLERSLYGTEPPDRLAVLDAYRDYMARRIARGERFKDMARHLLGFFTGKRGARAFRRTLSEHMFRADADLDVLDNALVESGLAEAYPMADTGT
ncbi:MAG: tRNA dihydrouridine(20/20a) synthase DusA [Gammaproteobacteria bacterium]|nr:tRNA dihydrouridine(20/20a) synthase DusA [Gammaproteobacteria bacterium]